MEKNQIIIDNIEFFINNFNGTGTDYKVCAYAQDIEESDMYGVDIYEIHDFTDKDDNSSHEIKERISTMYIDSCGGCLEYEAPGAVLTELEEYVLHILFGEQQKGIIRGF
jgi:hypothetical protein